MTQRILVTGVDGFIGSHVVRWLLTETDWEVVGLGSTKPESPFHYNLLNATLSRLSEDQLARLERYACDLTQPLGPVFQSKLFSKPIDTIINLASDSQVDRSVQTPGPCWHNNCALIFNVLELARHNPVSMFIQISSDEVYGEVTDGGPGHPEWDTILPSNPYSASKAAQEALAIAYWKTYDVPVVLANIMSVIGEWQNPARFLPMVARAVYQGEPVKLFTDASGEPAASRCWLDVQNLAAALVHICEYVFPDRSSKGKSRPDRVHIVGEEMGIQEMAERVAYKLNKPLHLKLVPGQQIRPGYSRRYAMQDLRLRNSGFVPRFTLEATLDRILAWAQETGCWIM